MQENKASDSQKVVTKLKSNSEQSIAVLGAGAWGTAIAIALARSGHLVRLHARNPDHAEEMRQHRMNMRRLPGRTFPSRLAVTDTMIAAVAGADVVFLAGPSRAVEEQARAAREFAEETTPFVLCAKGLAEDGDFLCSRVEALRDGAPVLMLSGPSFAEEVAEGCQTIVTLSGPRCDAEKLCSRLSSKSFVLSPCSDVKSVQIAGVFKNVAAILCGASDGLNAGANARAALMSEAIGEAAAFVEACGGKVATLLGPAGFGDFALTCTDPKSRNYRMGHDLATGKAEGDETHEGATNANTLANRAEALGVDAPLVDAVADLVAGRITAREAVDAAFRQRLHRSRQLARVA